MAKSAAQVVAEARADGEAEMGPIARPPHPESLASEATAQDAQIGPCVVVLEQPRCRAVSAVNGQSCGALVAERLVYVRGVDALPAVRCRRCGTLQEYGGEM